MSSQGGPPRGFIQGAASRHPRGRNEQFQRVLNRPPQSNSPTGLGNEHWEPRQVPSLSIRTQNEPLRRTIGTIEIPEFGKSGLLPKHVKEKFGWTHFEYLVMRACARDCVVLKGLTGGKELTTFRQKSIRKIGRAMEELTRQHPVLKKAKADWAAKWFIHDVIRNANQYAKRKRRQKLLLRHGQLRENNEDDTEDSSHNRHRHHQNKSERHERVCNEDSDGNWYDSMNDDYEDDNANGNGNSQNTQQTASRPRNQCHKWKSQQKRQPPKPEPIRVAYTGQRALVRNDIQQQGHRQAPNFAVSSRAISPVPAFYTQEEVQTPTSTGRGRARTTQINFPTNRQTNTGFVLSPATRTPHLSRRPIQQRISRAPPSSVREQAKQNVSAHDKKEHLMAQLQNLVTAINAYL